MGTEINLPAVHNPNDELFRAMFGPLAGEIGEQLLDDFRRRSAGKIEAKERENLKKHVAKVREIQPDLGEIDPTKKQKENVEAWIAEAGDAAPESDPAISAKWESLLSEILSRNDELIVDVIRQLNRYDIEILRNIKSKESGMSQSEKNKFQALGIIETQELDIIQLFPKIILVLCISVLTVLLSSYALDLIISDLNNSLDSAQSNLSKIEKSIDIGTPLPEDLRGIDVFALRTTLPLEIQRLNKVRNSYMLFERSVPYMTGLLSLMMGSILFFSDIRRSRTVKLTPKGSEVQSLIHRFYR